MIDDEIDVSIFDEDIVASAPQLYHADWLPDLLACRQCAIREEASRVVTGVGPANARILVIGQNPGEEEDDAGIPFMGRGGRELDRWLNLLQLDRTKIAITNIVKCHTEHNRRPKDTEARFCMETWLQRELASLPEVQILIPLGKLATRQILGKDLKTPGIMEACWARVQWKTREFAVVPLTHPAYFLRAAGSRQEFYERVLPPVRRYLVREWADAYTHSRVTQERP